MRSKKDISRIIISEEPQGALFQGDLGNLIKVKMVEGVMLEIHGDKGVFRVDLIEDELLDGLEKRARGVE